MTMPAKLSKYEQAALREIHRWKHPKPTWFSRATKWASKPLDAAGRVFNKIPGIEWVLQKSIGGLISLLNDGASWSVRPEAIYREYRNNGYNVNNADDIFLLDLADVDKVIGALGAKYRSISAAEGGGTGAGGLIGIPIDIVSMIFLSLRGIGEYATYCGFNPRTQSEQLFALGLLGYCSSPDQAAKNAAMTQLVKLARDVATKKPWKELEQSVVVQIIKRVAEAVGHRLTKQKLAQIMPIFSAGIGLGFNVYFMGKIVESSFYLYRERFLAAKYGPEVIETSGSIPESYIPSFNDVSDEIGHIDDTPHDSP